MMKVCDLVCPEKKQAFSNVSLSRNTEADRTCDLATNLYDQLMEKGKDFVAFSLAVDESSDTSNTAQLSVFFVWSEFKSVCYGGTFGIKINAWYNHRKENL